MEGRLLAASNLALRVWVSAGARRIPAVYKPVRGERPLWDFPDGSLAAREVAAAEVAVLAGWPMIPVTVMRQGPLGPGSVQQWVGPLDGAPEADLVRIDPPAQVPAGYAPVLAAESSAGEPMVVSHTTAAPVRRIALADVVLNNADRKASALIADGEQVWAIDHGVCFHVADKLRTVLWGFAGCSLSQHELDTLRRLRAGLAPAPGRIAALLGPGEVAALRGRVERLLRAGTFPQPPEDRTPLPWPLW